MWSVSSLERTEGEVKAATKVLKELLKDENYHQEVLVQAAFYEDTVSGIFLEPGRSMISKGGDKGAQGVTKLSANQVASPLVDIFLS